VSELHDLAMKIRYDLTAAQAKLTELLRQIGELPEDAGARARCHCGLTFPGPRTLAEHEHVSHGGPVPEHWTATDALVAPDDDAMLHAPKSQAS